MNDDEILKELRRQVKDTEFSFKIDAKGKLTIFNINYCPMCGRELEVNNE